MTDTKALDALIEAVEAGGTIQPFVFQDALNHGEHAPCAGEAFEAYHGDLNAAKALHEALLPGWGYAFGDDEKGAAGVVARDLQSEEIEAHSEIPARAWPLAVLKAYRASL